VLTSTTQKVLRLHVDDCGKISQSAMTKTNCHATVQLQNVTIVLTSTTQEVLRLHVEDCGNISPSAVTLYSSN
jgi:hypothetical protein